MDCDKKEDKTAEIKKKREGVDTLAENRILAADAQEVNLWFRAKEVTVTVLCMWSRRLLMKMFSNVVHLSHSRFLNFHNFILPMSIFVFFFSLCVPADVDAEVSIGDDNDDDDGGDYYYDDFATHVHDDDEDDDKT
ncbi:hypothetical protein ElyMa_004540100 [Elysia marginata]|uniref:Uncharacterized protein n=1 Tax=Elysia marginata TaxID=1093978 RepID=A0AAV4HR95_9GAST|nr:hypothetical protein ElyMa_004540100 [Elysia marginata]